MLIYVRTAGGLIQLHLPAEETVDDVMARLRMYGVDVQDHALQHQCLLLEDRDRSLAQHGVLDQATLTLLLQQPYEILIKPLMRGDMFTLSVFPRTTISGIKRKIQERLGLLPEDQTLVAKGRRLDDGTMLCDIETRASTPSQLFLVIRPSCMLVEVRLLSGAPSFIVTVMTTDTMAVLKGGIQERGYEPSRYHLIFKGAVLKDDTATMQMAGISDGMVVHLVQRVTFNGTMVEDDTATMQMAGISDGMVAQLVPDDAELCVVCLDAQKTHAFLPCGHWCVCSECNNQISHRQGPCPMCREAVTQTVRIFV